MNETWLLISSQLNSCEPQVQRSVDGCKMRWLRTMAIKPQFIFFSPNAFQSSTSQKMGAFETTKLSALRSEEQLSLLDEIDKLRRSGISDHVSLPQIAVCGDQSNGKSSCLEAIPGIPFPRKDTLYTRFVTRRSLTARIMPNKGSLIA